MEKRYGPAPKLVLVGESMANEADHFRELGYRLVMTHGTPEEKAAALARRQWRDSWAA